MGTNRVALLLYVDPEVKDRIKAIADKEDVSVSIVGRRLLKQALADEEQK